MSARRNRFACTSPRPRSTTCASASPAPASPTRRPASPGPTAPTSPICRAWSSTGAPASTGARRKRGSMPSRSSRCRCTASTCTSCTSRARGPDRSRSCSRTAGRARSSSSWTSFRASPTRPVSAATRPTPSPWSRPRCPATACRSSRGSRASAWKRWPIAFAELMTEVLGYPRFAAQGGDWGAFITSRLGAVHAEQADRHPPQPAGAAARCQARQSHGRGEGLSRRARDLAQGGDGLPVDPGHAAADARLRPHRLAGRPRRVDRREVPHLVRLRRRRGERVLARSPAREHQPVLVHRSDRLLVLALLRAACTGRGRSAKAASARRWATPPSRARSSARRARWLRGGTRTSAAGPRCRAAAISRRWSSPRRWRGRSSSSSGRSGRARAEASLSNNRVIAAATGRGGPQRRWATARCTAVSSQRSCSRASAAASIAVRVASAGSPPSARRFIDSSNAAAAARHSAQGGEIGFAILALGLGRQGLDRLRLERVEPAQGDVAADVGGLAGGRERWQLGPQAVVEGAALVVDPRDDDAGEERPVRRRLGTAAHSVAVVVNQLERLSHRVLVCAPMHACQHHRDPAACCNRRTDERCRPMAVRVAVCRPAQVAGCSRAKASSWSMQVFQPSKKPISS